MQRCPCFTPLFERLISYFIITDSQRVSPIQDWPPLRRGSRLLVKPYRMCWLMLNANRSRDAAVRLGLPVLAKHLKPRDLALALAHVLVDLVEKPSKCC